MKTSSKPSISVLMPVYNTEKYLAEAVESIRNQTFCDFEFIILDDGSTDRSLGILRRFARQDPRIVVHSRENRGLVATRNQLMQLARGEWLVWADSDDISYPFRIERLLKVMQSDRAIVWVGSAYRLVDPSGWPICKINDPSSFGIGSSVIAKEVALDIGGFCSGFCVGEDTEFGMRMKGSGKIEWLKETLLDYRQHFDSVCNSLRNSVNSYISLAHKMAEDRNANGEEFMRKLDSIKKNMKDVDHGPEEPWKTHLRWAWWALMDGNVWTARKHSFFATIKNPKKADTWKGFLCAMRGY